MAQQHLYRRFTLLVLVALLAGWAPAAPVAAVAPGAAVVPHEADHALTSDRAGAIAATSIPPRPSLTLGVLVAPDSIGIGETASITLTVDNRDGIAATNLVVTLPTPDGAVALPGPGWIGATQGWRWNLGAFAGPSTILTASLQLTTLPTSNVLLLRARATAGNISGPIDARGGAMVIDRSLSPVTAAFTPGVSTLLRGQDGRVSVQFPATAAARPLTLRYGRSPLPGQRRPWDRVNGHAGLAPIFLDATDAQQNEVHQFTAPLTLTVAYTPEQLQALDIGEADLTLFWFDESQDRWVPLPTTIDSAARTVSAQVDHFSAFQLSDGSSPSKAYLPSLQGFQLSTYTGATSTQIPIDVPAGPGGLKPSLSLNYSSSATDGRGGERAKWQAGWVGKGWSLEAGSVALDRSTAGTGWNHFSFTFSGQSFDVVRGPMTGAPINSRTCTDYSNDQPYLECWQWHSTDENFARMRAIPLQATLTTSATVEWQAWTKDGTRYDFGLPLWWAWHNDDNTRTHEPYKWLLTGVTDTHGNAISYTYHVDSVGMPVDPGQPLVLGHPTWYLQSINWGYDGATPGTGTPHYQVSFDVSNRTTAVPTQGVDPNWEYFNSQVSQTWQASAPHEIYRLDAINVKSMQQSAGTYQLMHQYKLHYATVGSSIHTDDYLATDSSVYQPVLTLLDVQEYGSDGTTALPKRMFTYGTNPGSGDTRPPEYNRLIQIQNSEGGQLSFTYEHAFAKAGVPADECWCNYRNYNRIIQTLAQDTSGHSYATSALTTYDYTNAGQNTAALNDENHAATVVYAHYPPSGTGDGRMYLARLEKTEFRGHWYVVEKHYDAATADPLKLLQETRHWFYQGNGGSANTVCIPHRHSVGTNKSALDASELDPTGNPNSCFQQMFRNEAFKGHEYQTEIRDNTGALILQTLHSFTRQDLPFFGSDPGFFNSNPAFETQSNNYKRNGLWRAFVFENQITENSYEAGSLIRPKTTQYFYNPACDPAGAVDIYGNLGCTQELNAVGGIFRTTKHWFNNRNDGLTGGVWGPFIVDRLWQQATYDDQGKLAALTNQFYDGNNTVSNTVGTKGELTRIAKYYDAPPQAISASGPVLPNGTVHSSDTSYTYDTYGNQVSATTYASAGTRTDSSGVASWSAPGSSSHARATTTSYDGIFHSFPMTATNALGQAEHADYDFQLGTLIRVSGPNVTGAATDCHPASFSIPVGEETTCAQYDVFGRMIKLIKPGASASVSTVQAVYHDIDTPLALPIRYEVRHRDTSADSIRETQQFYDGLGRQIQTKAESQDDAQNIVTDMVYDGMDRVVQQSQPHYLPESGGVFTSYTAPLTLTNPTATSYDALGRVAVVDPPDHNKTSHFYLVWNDNGVPRVAHNVVDAKRHRTKSSTDVAGRLIKVEEISGTCGQWSFSCASPYTSTWALYATTNYTYTALDQLGGVTDTNGNHTVNSYDSLGRKTQALDPDLGIWAYMYDANSNLLSQTDARGKRICFFYDDLDRLTAKHYQDNTSACPASAPNSANDVSYGYDQGTLGLGHRTAMSIVAGATTVWTYDARGRKLTETYSNVPGLAAGQTRQFTWMYDVADRVVTLAYPATASVSADTVTYTYDAAWRQTSLTSSLGGLSATASQPATALDQPSQWTFGNGAIQTWSYDTPMQRVARIQATTGASTVLDHSYGYDSVGNVAAITDTVNLPAVQDFDYDHRDRLIHSGPAHASGLGMAALFGTPTATDSVDAGIPATVARALAFELRMPGDDALATGAVPPTATSSPASSAPKPAAARASAPVQRPDFGRLPLAFVPNQGQTDAQARFLVHGAGGTLFFTPAEMLLTLPDPSDTVTTTVVRLRYDGANASPTISAHTPLPGVVNYLIGGDSTKWRTNVPTYAGLTYGALYSGVDLHYDGTDGKLKSTYVVAPNVDASQIRWRYLGARDLQVDSNTGDLIISLGGIRRGRTLTEHAPLAWQDLNGSRVMVSARFDVATNGSVGFVLGSYDHSQPLTIDPILTYATYHGGNHDDKATAIVLDSSGQAIVAGYTTSNTGFPLQGALYASYRGNTDAFVSKFNAAGSALVFSTYIGGSNEDKANAVTLDPSGNIVIAGKTESGGVTPFPTQGAMDGTYASGGPCSGGTCEDVFISKLNAAGSSLLYSTFFGGTGGEEADGVAADSGAIYATGIVTATGMTTKNYYDNFFNGPSDAFLIKVDPSVSGSNGLLYSTYLGGSSNDEAKALALGSSGKVYLTGDTKSSNYPTKTAYQGSNAGGQDAFVTAIDTTVSGVNGLLYSTYLGGSATDEGDGIVLDASSNAYITGSTSSSAWPTKTPWQSTIAGEHDAILTEINPAAATGAASLLYSTYIGSTRDDRGQAIARDSSGVLYLTGYTNSISYPTTLAVQPTFGGGTCGTISCTDAFVTAFNITANAPVYSTFLGNNNNDQGLAIAADSSGAAYVAGYTDGTFPTASPRQEASGGQRDAFVAKLSQPTVALGAATASVAEGAGSLNLTVTLSAASPVTVTVDYTTANGTATAGSDYTAQSGTLTFAPGVTTQLIGVPIADDLSDEPNETFTVTLSGPSGARLGTIPSTTVTITDDDAPPTVAWQGANTNVGEAAGAALVPVVLSAPSAFTVTVAYATSNGTATAGSDYTSTSGTLTFAPSQTALNISIPITDDATAEPNETVTLTLSSPTNATLGSPNPATLTIVDNDGGSSGSDEYEQYDALGNLLQKGATAYTYGANGNGTGAGPHQARSVGGQTYSYDADGNLTAGGTRTGMLWDTENRLTSVTNAGVTETYGYDADGERITRTSGVVTTVNLGELWEETSAGAVKQYYSFNGTVIAVRDSSAGVSYLHGDHLGSVSVTTGAQPGPQTYGPWGNVTSGGSSATARNYTGQYLDSTTGLLYYHARYYDATLARFISADTQAPDLANPQDLNPYSYVRNNPLTFNDPSGHCESNPEDMGGEGAEACAEAIGEAVGGEGGKPPECYRCNTSEYDTPGARVECYTGGECGSPMDAPNQSAAAQARAEEAGEAGPAETNPSGARFEVTESGVAIPTDPEELHQNLSQLQDTSTNPESSRKFVGRDSQGPVRIRVEKGHPEDPDFNGKPDPLHVVDHLHIDRRKNVETGSWNSREKVSYGWPF